MKFWISLTMMLWEDSKHNMSLQRKSHNEKLEWCTIYLFYESCLNVCACFPRPTKVTTSWNFGSRSSMNQLKTSYSLISWILGVCYRWCANGDNIIITYFGDLCLYHFWWEKWIMWINFLLQIMWQGRG